eukprot:PhM_4_TR4416/c0_g1_i1/m.36857
MSSSDLSLRKALIDQAVGELPVNAPKERRESLMALMNDESVWREVDARVVESMTEAGCDLEAIFDEISPAGILSGNDLAHYLEEMGETLTSRERYEFSYATFTKEKFVKFLVHRAEARDRLEAGEAVPELPITPQLTSKGLPPVASSGFISCDSRGTTPNTSFFLPPASAGLYSVSNALGDGEDWCGDADTASSCTNTSFRGLGLVDVAAERERLHHQRAVQKELCSVEKALGDTDSQHRLTPVQQRVPSFMKHTKSSSEMVSGRRRSGTPLSNAATPSFSPMPRVTR